jgi:hypothetical protein
MNKKLFYTAPASKVFEVRLEGVIAAQTNQGGGGNYGDDDTNDNGDY